MGEEMWVKDLNFTPVERFSRLVLHSVLLFGLWLRRKEKNFCLSSQRHWNCWRSALLYGQAMRWRNFEISVIEAHQKILHDEGRREMLRMRSQGEGKFVGDKLIVASVSRLALHSNTLSSYWVSSWWDLLQHQYLQLEGVEVSWWRERYSDTNTLSMFIGSGVGPTSLKLKS